MHPSKEEVSCFAAAAARQCQVTSTVLCCGEGGRTPRQCQCPSKMPVPTHSSSGAPTWFAPHVPMAAHARCHGRAFLQGLQRRRQAALDRVKSALASPIHQQQVQHTAGSASWRAPADTSRLQRRPSPEGRPGLPGFRLSTRAPEASRSASPQAQGQGVSVPPAGGDGRPTAAQQASRRPPVALEWAAGWGRQQLEAGQQAAAQEAPWGQGSLRLQVQPSAYVPPLPQKGQGQEQPFPYSPPWQQEEGAQAEGLVGAGPLQGLPGGGLFGWQQSGSPHSLQPQPSTLQQLIMHQAATMQVRSAVQWHLYDRASAFLAAWLQRFLR